MFVIFFCPINIISDWYGKYTPGCWAESSGFHKGLYLPRTLKNDPRDQSFLSEFLAAFKKTKHKNPPIH